MSKIRSEIKRTNDGHVLSGDPVLFDPQSQLSAIIPYDTQTGELTFNEPGLYSVKWWVATETTPREAMEFALEISSDNNKSEYIKGCSPIKTGQISGFAAIDIKAPGTKLALKNTKETKTVFSLKTAIKAYLLAMRINTEYPSGLIGVYHANLTATGSYLEVVVGKVVYRVEYYSAGVLRMRVRSMAGKDVTVDIKRSTQLDSGYNANSLDNYPLTETGEIIDTSISTTSNEMNRTWLRQQDPDTGLWSLHEIDLFASAGGSRVTVFVYLVYENIDLSGL